MRELAILCVDDESTILHAITEELKTIVSDDIIIESALDANEALEICEEFEDEGIELVLVISDCIMPGMQGDKLLEQIHIKYPDTYKVMLTGQAEMEAIKYAINNANLYRYMTKPWEQENMKLTVESALQSYEDNYELESYKKDLEEKVKIRTSELKNAMDLVHEYALYTLVDKYGNILECSDSYAVLCGLDKDKLESMNIFETIANDVCENCVEDIKNALNTNSIYSGEIKNKCFDLKETWIDINITPFKSSSNEDLFSIKRYDISDKKYIQELCDTDVLTSLYNRRFFNSLLPKEIQRIKRAKNNLSFMMIDVDNFKKYNDTYGHQKGDEALFIVANILKDLTNRGSDFAFRLGGEEFAILTSDMTKEESLSHANSINKKLYEKKVLHEQNTASPYLSVSIGMVFYENGNISDSIDTMIKASDDLLYKAKESGRNQVILDQKIN